MSTITIIAQNGAQININQSENVKNTPKKTPDESGIIGKMTAHKRKSAKINRLLADIASERGLQAKAASIRFCGTYLTIREYKDAERTRKLQSANFCRNPLCPMCAWRLSLKWARWLHRAAQKLIADGYKAYHLILTQPSTKNISRDTIAALRAAAKKFYAALPIEVEARAETIEITIGAAGYHPHIHALIFSRQTYEHSMPALSELRKLWRQFMPSERDYTICALYPVKEIQHDVAEVCKYAMSPETTGIITRETVETVADTLHGLRKYITDKKMSAAIRAAKEDISEEETALEAELMACGWRDLLYEWETESGYSLLDIIETSPSSAYDATYSR